MILQKFDLMESRMNHDTNQHQQEIAKIGSDLGMLINYFQANHISKSSSPTSASTTTNPTINSQGQDSSNVSQEYPGLYTQN
jgi:hypothetical protein